MLLKYVNEDYDDTVYALDANESDKNHWPSNKDHLGLDFPNLPYYIDDQIKSSQSGTILRYLGRKYKMAGANEQETTTIEMLIDTATDLKTIIGFPAYTSADNEVINLITSNFKYRISSYSFRGNYSFLFWIWSQYIRPKVTVHKCAETIQGRKLYEDIRYIL